MYIWKYPENATIKKTKPSQGIKRGSDEEWQKKKPKKQQFFFNNRYIKKEHNICFYTEIEKVSHIYHETSSLSSHLYFGVSIIV